MKKKYLTYAGIIAALILAGMFVGILLSASPFPFLSPAVTIDPITDMSVDENNMLVLTGTTTLPENTYNISLKVSASGSLLQGNATGRTRAECNPLITGVDGGHNRWRGACEISELLPAEYTADFVTYVYGENFSRTESAPLATAHFTLGNENAPEGSIRKKTRVVQPFIRINPADQIQIADNHRITGITSLAPDTPLAWSMHGVTDSVANTTQEYTGATTVAAGTDGINRWTVLPGTGALEPARYQFTIRDNQTGTALTAGTVSSSAEFEVIPLVNTGGTGKSPGFITIDALPDIRINNVYVITGTTSLSPGDEVTVMVYPASFETNFNFSLDAKETKENRTLSGAVVFSGMSGMTEVVNGSGGENLWSFRLETYQIGGGQYEINVTNDGFDFGTGTIIYGDLFSSRILPISGDRT